MHSIYNKKQKNIRFCDIANLVVNKRTNQYSLNLKKRQLVKFGINPENMMDGRFIIKQRLNQKPKRVRWQ